MNGSRHCAAAEELICLDTCALTPTYGALVSRTTLKTFQFRERVFICHLIRQIFTTPMQRCHLISCSMALRTTGSEYLQIVSFRSLQAACFATFNRFPLV